MSETWYGLAESLAYLSGEEEGGLFPRSNDFLTAFPRVEGGGGRHHVEQTRSTIHEVKSKTPFAIARVQRREF
jgi:hypothetical protein